MYKFILFRQKAMHYENIAHLLSRKEAILYIFAQHGSSSGSSFINSKESNIYIYTNPVYKILYAGKDMRYKILIRFLYHENGRIISWNMSIMLVFRTLCFSGINANYTNYHTHRKRFTFP